MAESPRKLEDIEWVGGSPALDFLNTVHSRVADCCQDYLTDYATFLKWNQMADLVCDSDAKGLAATNPRAQAKAFAEALELREAMYRIFHAAVAGKHLPEDDLEHLNQVVKDTARWRQILPVKKTCTVGWDFEDPRADALLGPVAWEAIALLTGDRMQRVKECPGPDGGCGWLFVDESKNRSRQWCSMKTCGNHAKVKRFREKRA